MLQYGCASLSLNSIGHRSLRFPQRILISCSAVSQAIQRVNETCHLGYHLEQAAQGLDASATASQDCPCAYASANLSAVLADQEQLRSLAGCFLTTSRSE